MSRAFKVPRSSWARPIASSWPFDPQPQPPFTAAFVCSFTRFVNA
jgi:hypothetical protein